MSYIFSSLSQLLWRDRLSSLKMDAVGILGFSYATSAKYFLISDMSGSSKIKSTSKINHIKHMITSSTRQNNPQVPIQSFMKMTFVARLGTSYDIAVHVKTATMSIYYLDTNVSNVVCFSRATAKDCLESSYFKEKPLRE